MPNYYVDSVLGLDSNPGTGVAPWKTITQVNVTAKAGDVISFMRNRTFPGELIPNADGITYTAYGTGVNPIIDSSAAAQSFTGVFEANHTLQYLRLTGGSSYGVLGIGVSGLVIADCEIDNVGLAGIFLDDGTQNVSIERCSIHQERPSAEGYGVSIGGSGAAVQNITIRDCDIYASYREGIRTRKGDSDPPVNITIRNNTIRDGINGGGIELTAGTNVQVFYNIIANHPTGIAIFVFPSTIGGIQTVTGMIYHNTIVGNYYGIFFSHNGGGIFSFTVKNNLLQANALAPGSSSEIGLTTYVGWVGDYQLVWHPAGGNFMMYEGTYLAWPSWRLAISPQESHSMNLNPMLNPDYTLQVGSPAIDSGVFIPGISVKNPPNIGARDNPPPPPIIRRRGVSPPSSYRPRQWAEVEEEE